MTLVRQSGTLEMHGSCQQNGCQWPQGLGEMVAERDRYREALEMVGTDCANYCGPTNCVNAGRIRGARYTADAWCDQCIAREALDA